MKHSMLLALIVVCALAVRVYLFGQIPYGVNRDEAALGYNAYLLLQTGKDEHGETFPLQFESFGDWKKPGYVYLSMIPVGLFGLSTQSIRVLSLTASLLLIIGCSKIVSLLVTKTPQLKNASLWTAILIAVSPWHFFFSRIASETMVATAFFIWGAYFFLGKLYKWGIIFFIIALFTYHAFLLYVPLFVCVYGVLYGRQIPNSFRVPAMILGMFIIYFFQITFFSAEKAKATGLVIFDISQQQKQELMDKRTEWYSRFIHNRYVFVASTFIKNYVRSFSPEFLLIKGGQNASYQVPGHGNTYPIEVLACLAGVWFLARQKKKIHQLILAILIIAPIPAAITFEAVHSARQFMMSAAISMIAGVGIAYLVSLASWKKVAQMSLVVGISWSALAFFKSYFGEYRLYSDHVYHGYMKEVVSAIEIAKNSSSYERVIVTFLHESPYIFYAFYNQLDPNLFLTTINYYPPDFEGFRHVHSLDEVIYEERDEEAIALKEITKQNNLIFSRPGSLEYWIKPLGVWDNLMQEREIVSWQENQI